MIYHNAIFYPDSKEELEALVLPVEHLGKARCAIVPHMALRGCATFYRSVFSSIPDGTRIVALLPLHRPPLSEHGGKILFESRAANECTLLGNVRIGSFGLEDGRAYDKEEYSRELILPFAAAYTPSSTLHAVYTYVKKSKDMKELRHFLSSIDDGNTFFLISSNMTPELPENEMARMMDATIKAIESEDHLLDLYQKGRIGACATAEIECVRSVAKGRWELIGKRDEDKMCGHACFIMR